MGSRSLAELTAAAERLGLSVRVTCKWPADVPPGSGLEGFYAVPVALVTRQRPESDGTFSLVHTDASFTNPEPGAEETFLGKSLDEAQTTLQGMAK